MSASRRRFRSAASCGTLIFLLGLAACAAGETPSRDTVSAPARGASPASEAGVTPAAAPEGAVAYRCAEDRRVFARYGGQRADVYWQDRQVTMATVIAASGARYVGEDLEWWTRGRMARLSRLSDGETLAYDCHQAS